MIKQMGLISINDQMMLTQSVFQKKLFFSGCSTIFGVWDVLINSFWCNIKYHGLQMWTQKISRNGCAAINNFNNASCPRF